MSQQNRFAQEIFQVSRILKDLPILSRFLEISSNGSLLLKDFEGTDYFVSTISDGQYHGLAGRPMIVRDIWIESQNSEDQTVKLSQIYLHQLDKYLEIVVCEHHVDSYDDYPPTPKPVNEMILILSNLISLNLGNPIFIKNKGNDKYIEGSFFCLFGGSSVTIHAWKYFSQTLFLFANQNPSSFSVGVQFAYTSSLNAF